MREDAPGEAVDTSGRATFGAIVWRIKTSCFATFAYGYFQASVVLFLPLYLRDVKHVTEQQVLLVSGLLRGRNAPLLQRRRAPSEIATATSS